MDKKWWYFADMSMRRASNVAGATGKIITRKCLSTGPVAFAGRDKEPGLCDCSRAGYSTLTPCTFQRFCHGMLWRRNDAHVLELKMAVTREGQTGTREVKRGGRESMAAESG